MSCELELLLGRPYDLPGRALRRPVRRISRGANPAPSCLALGAGLRGGKVVMLRVGDIDCRHAIDEMAGPQGSACHAVAAASGVAASVVAAVAVARLAVPGPRSASADAVATSIVAATLVRHPPVGERYSLDG